MRTTFPDDLPISAARTEIAAAIAEHQVVVVAGETGSGKTTQLPKICVALGRGTDGVIGHTQPRRIAARSVAERIAEETGATLGDEVGFQVRFTDQTSPATRIKVMTDGILLAELQHDRDLRRYDTIIIDEAHERSLNIDFLLGYLKRLLPRRPDLKLIITSATIDPQRFADYFGGAPVIEVSGRTYPVEVRYRPLEVARGEDEEGEVVVRDQTEAIVDAVRELLAEPTHGGPGDVLVFLPGEREIRDTADALAGLAEDRRGGFEVLPLFSRLSAAEQHRVFARHSRRRVVLATNVAETSLTVPGIRYVVDTGVARISRYSMRTKVQRLPVEPISQASARQRSGRCGRVAPGVAIRLYDEDDFEARPAFTDPEILRTNLASVILQMTSLGLGDVTRFEFLDPPDVRQVRAGVQLLEELNAIRAGGGRPRLTGVGRRLARLPIDPRMGRMMLEADRLGCLGEVIVIVAALSVQDPRERPVDAQERADQLHARFRDPTSDFLAWLNLWSYLRGAQRERGSSAFRRLCREEHLNYVRIREWQDLVGQLRQVAKEVRLKGSSIRGGEPAAGVEAEARAVWKDADLVHQALLAGLLSHIGLRQVADKEARGRRLRGEYDGARGTTWAIFPGSGLFKKPPELAMAAELVETGRLWGRQVAAIDPAWAERLGEHLVKRQYAEPHWSRKRAAVMARERVTLYGVPLVADRLVNYGRHDPAVARELFIRHALVGGDWNTRHRFLATNRQLLAEAEDLEHRARRRGIVIDEETLVDFYDQRIGAEVVSGAHFDTWWKQARREQPDLLTFDPAMLVREEIDAAAYPTTWHSGDLDLSVGYRYEPGSHDDGVTVDVPVAALHQLDSDAFGWQVPGLREKLVVALIRGLPKSLRTSFVPVPDVARAFLAAVPAGEEPLTEALSRYLLARTGVVVPADAWDLGSVPEHLRPRFRVVDADGRALGSGRDLSTLATRLRPATEGTVAAVAQAAGLSRSGLRDWQFGDIAASVTEVRAGHEVRGFPCLVDEGDAVGLRVVTSAEEEEARHRLGVRRLARLVLPDPAGALFEALTNSQRLALAASPYPSAQALVDDCVLAVVGGAVDAGEPVRDRGAFDTLVGRLRPDLADRSRQTLLLALDALAGWREAERLTTGRVELSLLPAMTDLREQVAALFRDGFIAEAGSTWLARYPAYLSALRSRVAGLSDVRRERQLLDRLLPVKAEVTQRIAALPPGRPPGARLREARWLLEEYRVSLWAQSLGTVVPVSDARIRKLLG